MTTLHNALIAASVEHRNAPQPAPDTTLLRRIRPVRRSRIALPVRDRSALPRIWWVGLVIGAVSIGLALWLAINI